MTHEMKALRALFDAISLVTPDREERLTQAMVEAGVLLAEEPTRCESWCQFSGSQLDGRHHRQSACRPPPAPTHVSEGKTRTAILEERFAALERYASNELKLANIRAKEARDRRDTPGMRQHLGYAIAVGVIAKLLRQPDVDRILSIEAPKLEVYDGCIEPYRSDMHPNCPPTCIIRKKAVRMGEE